MGDSCRRTRSQAVLVGVEGEVDRLANRHVAKVADVWKHLPLIEVLSRTAGEVLGDPRR